MLNLAEMPTRYYSLKHTNGRRAFLVLLRHATGIAFQLYLRSYQMKFSLLATTLAFGLTAGLAAAQAAETTPAPAQQVAAQPSAATVATEQESYSAFESNINPTVAVKTTGNYDQEDEFVGRHGFPLGGWKEVSNPPS
jgi:hypothetical protein